MWKTACTTSLCGQIAIHNSVSRRTGIVQRTRSETLSCLWFQMLGVKARSSLPHDQDDRGNLSRQGQTRHLGPHAPGQQFRIELSEGAGLARRPEQNFSPLTRTALIGHVIFQGIVTDVSLESAL